MDDIRYVFRTLGRSPGFAVAAVISIALAIGANSTIFSFANGLLLRPLPVPDPAQLVTLRTIGPSVRSAPVQGLGESSMPYPEFEDFRRNAQSFTGMTAVSRLFAS